MRITRRPRCCRAPACLADAAVYARRLNTAFRRDDAVALLAARASEAAGDYSSSSTLMSSHFGPYLQQPASEPAGRLLGARLPARLLAGSLGGGRAPRRRSAADARPRAAGIAFRSDGTLARRRGRTVSGDAVHGGGTRPDVRRSGSARTPRGAGRERGARREAARRNARSAFGGALAPTIASYNADKERVQVWWDSAKGLPEELFIDSIPYQQTRAYVRQVLANYAMYQRSAQSASPRK